MYRKHFALTHFPFELALEPEALFASATLAEAEARLKHLLDLRAIGLITGEVGSGKTTVCLSQDRRRPASRPVPTVLRAAIDRQRFGYVQIHRLGAGLAC